MLYYIFKYLDEAYNLPGSGMFQYISFRAAASIILALLIVIIFGRKIIDFLRRKQIGEEVRDLGLEGQLQKRGTPTMGGVIILLAILVPILLLGRLDNIYIQLMLVSTVWLGLLTTSRFSATTRRGSRAVSRSWDRSGWASSSARRCACRRRSSSATKSYSPYRPST